MSRNASVFADLSVIVAVAPGADPAPALRSVRRRLSPRARVEVLTVTGRHPARQRNLAAHRARGRVLCFLDHDAEDRTGAPARLARALRAAGAAAAGGPNVGRPRDAFERDVDLAAATWLGSPFVRARYAPTGRGLRPAGERDLILCNAAFDRETFLAAGGFDPRLYPNEENELIGRLAAQGLSAVYDPGAVVAKPRPSSWVALARETFRYGRGRFEQIWMASRRSDLPFALVLAGTVAAAWAVAVLPHGWAIPLAYAAAVFAAGAALGLPRRAIAAVVVRHAAYVAGLAWGAVSGWRRRRLSLRAPLPVVLRRLVPASRGWRLVEVSSYNIGARSFREGSAYA